MRRARRWIGFIGLALGVLAIGASPAAAGRLKPRWKHVANASWVLVGPRYLFVDNPIGLTGQFSPGGTLIDTRTGKRTSIVPPPALGSPCGEASAISGQWLAFECPLPFQAGELPTVQIELYRISSGQWRVVPESVAGGVLGIGADWIEIWASQLTASGPYPRFVFQNIESGQTQNLAAWHPGGRIVPNLNSPSLAQTVCAPIRVPLEWQANGEDWPGLLHFAGRFAVVGGDTERSGPFGYLERCGTRVHRWIGPLGANASASGQAVIWQPSLTASDLRGAYLPSLRKFTVDTTDLVNGVVSGYYGGQNTYSSWLTARTLYVLVNPYAPSCDPMTMCTRDPSELYSAPAPRAVRRRRH